MRLGFFVETIQQREGAHKAEDGNGNRHHQHSAILGVSPALRPVLESVNVFDLGSALVPFADMTRDDSWISGKPRNSKKGSQSDAVTP